MKVLRPRRWRRAAWFASACLGGVGCVTTAGAQTTGLSLEQAIELALSRNERARIAGAESDAAAARLDRALSFFFPDLVATGSYTRRAYETVRTVDGDPVTIASRDALLGTISASMPLFDPRSIPLYRQAAREADAASLQATEDRRRLMFEAADAFLVTIGTEQVQAAAEHRVEYARGALQDAQARFDAGLVGSNDVTRFTLELASSERALANARALSLSSTLELGNLLDTRVQLPLAVPDSLLEAAIVAPPDPESQVTLAQARRLDLAASRKHAEAMHFSAREPLMRALPSLGLGAEARFTNEQGFSGRDHDWSVGLLANWTLFDGGERYADRDEQLALARIADLDVRALSRGVDLDVERSRATLEQAQASMRAATVAVEAARRNAAEITELYRQGLARVLEVADASLRLFEAEVALASERFGLGRSFLEWRAALGFDPLGRPM